MRVKDNKDLLSKDAPAVASGSAGPPSSGIYGSGISILVGAAPATINNISRLDAPPA